MIEYPFSWGRIEYTHADVLRVAYFVALIEQLNSGTTTVSLFRFDTQENACRCATGNNDSGDGLLETVTKHFWLYNEERDSLEDYNRCELAQAVRDCAHACNCIIDHVVNSIRFEDGNSDVTVTVAPTSTGVRRLVEQW